MTADRFISSSSTVVLCRPGFQPFRLRRLPSLDIPPFIGVEIQHADGTPMEHITPRPLMTPSRLRELFAECDPPTLPQP